MNVFALVVLCVVTVPPPVFKAKCPCPCFAPAPQVAPAPKLAPQWTVRAEDVTAPLRICGPSGCVTIPNVVKPKVEPKVDQVAEPACSGGACRTWRTGPLGILRWRVR